MTIRLASTKADLAKEAQGEWVDIPDWPGVALNVNSLESPAYKIARDLLIQKYARKYKGKPPPPEVAVRDAGRLYAQHILNGWRGFDIEYTPDVAAETLSDPAFRELARHVEWAAAQVGETEIEFVEQAAKNSAAPSATK